MKESEKASKLFQKGKCKTILFGVLYLLSLCGLIVSSYHIVSYFIERTAQIETKNQMLDEAIRPIVPTSESNAASEPLTSEKTWESVNDQSKNAPILTPDISVDFSLLAAKYPDLVGWLYIPGDLLSDPVMQSSDNDYYLDRLPSGKNNSAGSLFFDFRDSPTLSGWNHIVYGHNMKNKTMFGFLRNYRSSEFFSEHPYVFYFTPDCTWRIELFAGFYTTNDSFVYTRPDSEKSRLEYLKKAKQKSAFSSDVTVHANDPILILSTCAGAADSNQRFVVMGKPVALS